MKRVLRRMGLMRVSQVPVTRMTVDFATALSPTVVDIELSTGQRVRGAVDPWWPNKPPSFTLFGVPLLPLLPEEGC